MKITVSFGRTINMGNFNSLRVEAGMELESSINRQGEDFDWAWKVIKDEVENQIQKERV